MGAVEQNVDKLKDSLARAGALMKTAAADYTHEQIVRAQALTMQQQTDIGNADATTPGGVAATFGDTSAQLSTIGADGVYQEDNTPATAALNVDVGAAANQLAHTLLQAGTAYALRGLQ